LIGKFSGTNNKTTLNAKMQKYLETKPSKIKIENRGCRKCK
jgi:hypothetical protein